MRSARWSQVARIVHNALLREGPKRAVNVAEACGDDTDLRREVDSLLTRASAADDFLSRAAAKLVFAPTEGRLSIGDHLGPYAIVGLLGAGGMGEVYRARDRELGRDVAIKLLPRVFLADPERVKRFAREARVLASLNHPHIGAIYGLEPMDGVPALILEFIDGPNLAERLTDGPLPIAEAVTIAIQISEALTAAHDSGIVHRDIKPANIKITPAGTVKVLDFGLAKDSERHEDNRPPQTEPVRSTATLSAPGVRLGTVAYMSPEQARGEAVDARTDLFSLGAVLYEMVAGRPAFDSTESPSNLESIGRETSPSPRVVNRAVPRALDRVIVRLMHPSRDARYQTAAAVRGDLVKLGGDVTAKPSTGSLRRQYAPVAVAAIAATVIAAVGGRLWPASTPRQSAHDEYTQITHFADSATSPALSPDGRLLTFVRGESTFQGVGQIYVKALPDGEPIQLTSDSAAKMSPVFSPDGSRIAYTTIHGFIWDTWVVPLPDGTPRFWLANASGLTWVRDRVLFSEITTGLHMNVVTSDDKRESSRAVYTPDGDRGMAHRSYLSPDGAWVLIAEMTAPVWQPCRLVSMDGRASRTVGPPGQCTSAAWSPDGKWMYFSSNTSGSFHIWRQPFPSGVPEQVTTGPNEEEGIALAPDGASLLTSVGNRQSAIWISDGSGERAVSREGYAFVPGLPNSGMSQPFSRDGRLLYLVRQGPVRFVGPGETGGELWETDLEDFRSEPLLPGFRVTGYDLSRNGLEIVVAALDEHGTSHIWLAEMDRRTPPRQLTTGEADSPHFGAGGSVYYRASEGGASFIYRLTAGGLPERAVAQPVLFFQSVSPDDTWLIARVAAAPGIDSSQENLAFPTAPGKPPVLVCSVCEVDWTPNAKSLVIRLGDRDASQGARTFVVALQPGETLPRLPAHGIRTQADMAGLRISQTLNGFAYPADAAPEAAFVRSTTERNIYRVPLPRATPTSR